MAVKKNSSDPLDLDDLLELTSDDLPLPPGDEVDVPETITPVVEDVPALTPEQEEILALRAQVAALKDAQGAEPVETPEQKEIRELRAALAAAKADPEQDFVDGPQEFDKTPSVGKETILIHFVRDGFVACGQTWYRGQELEFVVGSLAHKQQFDINDNTWLDLADDIDAQFAKYGDQFFMSGPWRGRRWTEASIPEDLDASERIRYQSEVTAAAQKEQQRGRAAPIMR